MKKRPQKPLPLKAQLLISRIWQEVQAQPEHALPPQRRAELYRALWPALDLSGERREAMLDAGELPLSGEDHQFGHLAILTVQHVLPVWDRFATPGMHSGKGLGQEVRLPRWILEAAQDVLRERIEPLKAYEMLAEFYDLVQDVAYYVPYPEWNVANGAYMALNAVLGGVCFPPAPDSPGGAGDDDPARFAASACATIDDNPAGVWWSNPDSRLPFRMAAENSLGFWEWWLGTAVPSAWNHLPRGE